MDDSKLSKCRAHVIEKSIDIELLLSAIISQHYLGMVSRSFLLEVLYDEYFSFALKRRVLEKILQKRKMAKQQMLDDLNRLNTIRNYFAHLNIEFYTVLSGPEKGEKGVVPDPKNPARGVDFESLYMEFSEKQPKVKDYLFDVLVKMGGEVKRG
jgi:hypothetical protein